MIIYRVSYRDESDDEHRGYSYFRTLSAAKKSMKETENITTVDKLKVECSTAGILAALNTYGGHAENGG